MTRRAPSEDIVRQQSLVFEVTTRCNHDCLHCYNAWKNAAPYPVGPELPTGETLTMLGKLLDETGASLVSLSGGEPMLRADIFEIVDFLAERRVAVNLITNGTLLDAGAVERLAGGRISLFELPLLSSEREIHDRLSAAPGAFDKVTLAIAELKAAGERVVAAFVATRLNVHTWPETAETAFALGVDGIMLNRFNPGGRGCENLDQLQLSPDELAGALDAAQQIVEEFELPISCSIAMPPCLLDHARWPKLSFGFCAAGTERAYYTLDPVGNVRPCNHSPRILGNICETTFADLAGSAAMRVFSAARPAFCAGCRLEETCLGGCKAAAEACLGSAREMDPFLAAYRGQAVKPT